MPMTRAVVVAHRRERLGGRPGEDGAGGLVVDLAVGAVGGEPLVGQLGPHLDFLRNTHRRGAFRAAAGWEIRNESGGGGEGQGRDPGDVAAPQRLGAHGVVGGVEPDRPGQGEVRPAAPRSAYQRSTASSAAGTGMPGLPAVTTELARWVNPRDARSTQSPSRAVSIAGQAPTMTRWRSSTDSARCGLPRREGDGRDLLERGHLGAGDPHLAAPGAHHEDAVVVGRRARRRRR